MDINKISVLGAGTMGPGIALVCAQSGFQVILEDIKPEFVERGIESVRKFLNGSVERKKMTQEVANTILGRVKTATDLVEAGSTDLVIEAIVEDINVKKDTFKQLDQICPTHTVFASNTSYQSITEIASATKRPERFVGMHWFNPPPLMRGIEIVKTDKTSPEIVDTMLKLTRRLGKEPALCQDATGFIANRILQVWRNESFKLLDEGAASIEDIDKAFKTAYSFRMGPFELADLVGLDIALKGTETFYAELKRELFRPSRSLINRVRAGDYGRKTGQGFYSYKPS
jgi:3-hydroxybutyryl-CoA dehydrogenase